MIKRATVEDYIEDNDVIGSAQSVSDSEPSSCCITKPVTVTVTNSDCQIASSSKPIEARFGDACVRSQTAVYDTLFGSSFCVFDLSLQGLNPLLCAHGIQLEQTDPKVASTNFLEHILFGKCFDSSNSSHRACMKMRSIFENARYMVRFLLESFIIHETDQQRIEQICKALGMTEREFTNAKNVDSLLKYISYCKDSFVSVPSAECLMASLDTIPLFDLLVIARLHRIDVDNKSNVESLRCKLLFHFCNEICEFSTSSDHVTASCQSVNEEYIAARLKIIDATLHGKKCKRPLRRLLDTLQIPFDKNMSVRQLLILLKEEGRTLHRGKFNLNRRIIREKEAKDKKEGLKNHIKEIDKSWPQIVTNDQKNRLIADFKTSTGNSALKEQICAVCGESKRTCDIEGVTVSTDSPFLSVLRVGYPSHVPKPFPEEPFLDDLVIASKGVVFFDSDKVPHLRMCKTCHSSVMLRQKMPRLALANNLYLGPVPDELKDLTVVEEAMIAKRRGKCWVIHLKDSNSSIDSSTDNFSHHMKSSPITQRGLKGHIIIYPSHPEKLDNILPQSISDTVNRLCVIFVGSSSPSKEWLRSKARPLIVRREKIRAALIWLKKHNPLYRDVVINDSVLESLPEEDILPVEVNVERPQSVDNAEIDVGSCDNDKPSLFQNAIISDIDGHDVSRAEMSTAALKHLKNGGGFIQLPHDSVPSNDYTDFDLFPSMFPTLYPYGIGGFEHPDRRIPVSLENHARHLFLLGDKRFQEHYSFLFIVFNILQRRTVARSGKIKVSQSSFNRFASKVASLSETAIKAVNERVSRGEQPSANNDDERLVLQLMKEASLITSHVPGSAAGRTNMRNQIRGMTMDLGLPSFYVTINPADIYSPVFRFLAGDEINLEDIDPDITPDYWQQSIQVAKNPFIGAKFFDIYIRAFIETILAFDESRSFNGEGGIFGHVKGYYGCVEAQGRGSLHCHMLIWLQGALDPQQIKDRILSDRDIDFRDRLIRFIDDTISNEIPADPGVDVPLPYPNHHSSAVCGLGTLNKEESHIARRLKDFRRVVEDCQVHKHTPSCFKYCRKNAPKECRYNLDECHFNAETTMNMDSGEINYRVLNGMVNNYCPAILEALRCNIDVKFIGSGVSAKAILHYITDYITKTQLKTHVAYAALYTAIQKLQLQIPDDDDDVANAKKLLVKCANALISKQELSSPQVASYLMKYGDHYTSHKFESLYWMSFEKYIEEKEFNHSKFNGNDNYVRRDDDGDATDDNEDSADYKHIIVDRNQDGILFAKGNQVMDYIHRGSSFRDFCLWDFIAEVDKIEVNVKDDHSSRKDPQSDSESSDSTNDFIRKGRKPNSQGFFTPEHPECNTRMLRVRNANNRHVPVPIGARIYRRDQDDVYEKYCRLMLILFKPWSKFEDLRDKDILWSELFHTFSENLSLAHKKIIDNMQRLHECKDSRDEHYAKRHSKIPKEFTYILDIDCNDQGLNTENYTGDNDNDALDYLNDFEELFSRRRELGLSDSESAVSAATAGGLYIDKIKSSIDHQKWPEPTLVDPATEVNLEKDWLQCYEDRKLKRKKEISSDLYSVSQTKNENDDREPSFRTLNLAITSIDPSNVIGDKQLLDNSESELIERIIAEYTLNDEQAAAFRIVAEHSLEKNPEPFRLYLGGPGGTGKSRVINALQSFFGRQQQSRRLRLSSFTGVAAHNINGTTLHSLLSLMSIRNRKNSNRTKSELIAMWIGVEYLFIDEISMVGCQLLAEVSEALAIAKQCTGAPFGNVSMIFAGDFCQLNPVGDKSLYAGGGYIYDTPQDEQTINGQSKLGGRLLWLELTHCILLKKQMRQCGDKNDRFRNLLGRLRMGNCTAEDYDLLNTRLLCNLEPTQIQAWQDAPIITSQNVVKDALNTRAAESFARRTGRKMNMYVARDYQKRKLVDKHELKKQLLDLHTGDTNYMMGRLPLVEGMPVMITHNYDVYGGIVNGTRGVLKSVRYELDGNGVRHAKSCVVIVDLKNDECMPHLEKNEIVVLEEKVKFTITNPYTHSRMVVHRKQLPILPAFSITDFKSQGQTLPKLIVDLTKCRGSQSPYVMLSRATSLEDLLILRPFDISKIRCHVNESLREELSRLQILHNRTIRKLENNNINLMDSHNEHFQKRLFPTDLDQNLPLSKRSRVS